MERLILNTLNFKMGAPLCLHFLRRMVCGWKSIVLQLKTFVCAHDVRREPILIQDTHCHTQSKSAEAEPQTHTMAKYFMELTIPSYDMMTKYLPSQIAAAALCLSQKMLTCGDWVCAPPPLPQPTLGLPSRAPSRTPRSSTTAGIQRRRSPPACSTSLSSSSPCPPPGSRPRARST